MAQESQKTGQRQQKSDDRKNEPKKQESKKQDSKAKK